MPLMSSYPNGVFCWPGLCSGDAAKAKTFYSGLFGWDAVDQMMEGGAFTSFQLGGQIVGGMYQMPEARKAAGVRPHWNSYIAVDDATATAKKAAELGGNVLQGPFDAEGDVMSNLQDPTGAKFSVFESKKKPEPTLLYENGALVWNELYTPDPKRASDFYTNLLGWTAAPFVNNPKPYTVFTPAGQQRGIGGMLEITKEMGGMPPQWVPYFMVADADATAKKAEQLGAKIWVPPMDIPDAGRISMAADAEGAPFAFIKTMW